MCAAPVRETRCRGTRKPSSVREIKIYSERIVVPVSRKPASRSVRETTRWPDGAAVLSFALTMCSGENRSTLGL